MFVVFVLWDFWGELRSIVRALWHQSLISICESIVTACESITIAVLLLQYYYLRENYYFREYYYWSEYYSRITICENISICESVIIGLIIITLCESISISESIIIHYWVEYNLLFLFVRILLLVRVSLLG